MVTVYSKKPCVKCDATVRQLKKQGTDFELVDITNDEAEQDRLRGLGVSAMPYVVTPDETWSDYRPDQINALAS